MKAWLNQWVRFLMPVLVIALLLPLAGCGSAPELNRLSWLLYAADVLKNVQPFCGIVGVFVGIFAVIMCGNALCCPPHDIGRLSSHVGVMGSSLLAVSLLFLCIAMAIPSRTTLYAIAASQTGERAVQSEFGQELLTDGQKAVRVWFKKQLEPQD
jgi:hypothetical protein